MRWPPYRAARAGFARGVAPRGKRSLLVLVTTLLILVMWQTSFAKTEAKLDTTYQISAASGVHWDRNFVYFLYYLDLFPVVSRANSGCLHDTQPGCWDTAGTPAEYSHAAADAFFNANPKTLQQDLGWTWNAGDRGKIYLFLYDAWLKGAPWNPSPRPAARLASTIALGVLFAAMWWVRRPIWGGLLVLFLGSDPFQLYEVNGRDNVFGWPIIAGILLLGLHVPLLRKWKPHRWWAFAWPVGIGILMATLRTIRSEPVAMLAAVAATYALIWGFSWKRRAAMIGALAIAFFVTQAIWTNHFIRQQEHSATVIGRLGGHAYPESIRIYHHFWHAVWCGLGDYDEKYGYVWNDHDAAAYAKPFLEAKGIYVPSGYFIEGGDPREYVDPETKIYKRLPYDLPFYNDIIRDKILSDIAKDPRWYFGILKKRTWHILTETTPVRITWSRDWITIPWRGLFALPLVLFLASMRQRFLAGICLFTLPTVTSALVIFSGKGMTYYGVFHIVAFAVTLGIVIHQAIH